MTGRTIISGIAAPLPFDEIDTDAILPAQYLLRLDRALGPFLFAGMRGKAAAEGGFILDRPPYDKAAILVAGARFGVGSSREQAVWALMDAGIVCIIAKSFGDIFASNARRNGLLLIQLAGRVHDLVLAEARAQRPVTIDIGKSHIVCSHGEPITFAIDESDRIAMQQGLDETGQVLASYASAISAFEARQAHDSPWIAIKPQVYQQIGMMSHVDE